MMSFKVDSQNLVKLKERVGEEGHEREVARLNSLTLPYAGSWLLTPPIAVLGLHLRPTEFTLAARYRLGINVYDSDGPCPACQQFSDAKGDHALCCGRYGDRSPGITPSVTTSSLLHKLQHLVRCGRDVSSSLGLIEGQLMFFSQAGLMDLTVPWM